MSAPPPTEVRLAHSPLRAPAHALILAPIERPMPEAPSNRGLAPPGARRLRWLGIVLLALLYVGAAELAKAFSGRMA